MASPKVAETKGNGLPEKLVYEFGDGRAEGSTGMRDLLGGKGAGLAEMSNLGLPVPPGFTITTDVCTAYYDLDGHYPENLKEQVLSGIKHVEEVTGAKFGDPDNPLLVSVRSGARVSMPGMMDTVLNLGLNDITVEGLAERSNDPRFAYDSYRRFISMYGDVVLNIRQEAGLERDPFELLLEQKKEALGISEDPDLPVEALKDLVSSFKSEISEKLEVTFPTDPWEQLWSAIGAVFASWNSERAVIYRELNGFSNDWGTAVNVQAMVFGNLGDDCATGVAFTRNPKTGERAIFGEFLTNAQGEDIVAGVRTPQPISRFGSKEGEVSLEDVQPQVFNELLDASDLLESHFKDMQDIEFTVQQNKLWVLQTRNGKRTGPAMVNVAVDLVDQGMITEAEALLRQDPEQISELLHPILDPDAPREIIATGLPASPGAAVGKVVFTAKEASEWMERGEDVILVRTETSPEDIQGMLAAKGILTARGGMTSHAAVVARGWGKPCIAGCGSLVIDSTEGTVNILDSDPLQSLKRGDVISIDGSTGEVMLGAVPLVDSVLPETFERMMVWADRDRRLGIRANADTPEDAELAREFGAEGIGLCRTEHMFFGDDRILAVRRMILAGDENSRREALEEILPVQRQDFLGILRAMAGLPVTIRLLDPPLHEFLPQGEEEIKRVSDALAVSPDVVLQRITQLHEFNPMLGHRGVRLAVTYPEIYEVQAQAIIEAACILVAEGVDARPEIMIPLVGMPQELEQIRDLVVNTAEAVIAKKGVKVAYSVGTMIELPRACVVADQIAEYAEFFSFGTNDLTQTTLGVSRDDAGRFLPEYVRKEVLEADPFVTLDTQGVGQLMEIAVERGRSVKPAIKLGICGEHGGDPKSIDFGHNLGLDYVSCSPYRVLIARLAAAQAALR
tara:strand:+ start:2328 stop:5045 length:2718 start_codon:yes stop_codon:yes gene_type:complete